MSQAFDVTGVRRKARLAGIIPMALRRRRWRLIMTRSRVLWVIQGLLAVVFLFAGGMKLILPAEVLTASFPLPALFVRFIGVCEVLGALGLILPGVLRIRTYLTPLAAAGLVIVMIGATTFTVTSMGLVPALIPFVVGLLAATVAHGRYQLAPYRRSSQTVAPQLAR
jgi:hypothetical protein